jgi:MGT family glycosyltransferase
MHLFFTSIAAAGHVNPTLSVVRELADRGHRITYATGESLRSAVEGAGASLLPVPELALPDIDRSKRAEGLIALMRLQAQAIRDEVLDRQLEDVNPEAVCFDAMTLPGRVAASRLNLPGIALNPSYATNEHFSMRAMAAANVGAMPPEQAQMFGQLRQMSADLSAELGGAPVQLFGGPPADLNIVFIPRQFQYAGDTFDDRFHFVGPCLSAREVDTDWQPASGKPQLFISLGTTPFNNQPVFFRTCLEAFSDGAWQVAVAIGNQIDPAELGTVPDNVEVRSFFPQLAVLRHTDVFISHTGMNSTMESLYYGVPIVAVPQQPEQAANARRVEELGLGRHLTAELSADLLRRSVDAVHSDDRIRANLARMSDLVRNAGGPTAAADAIEAYLAGRSRS